MATLHCIAFFLACVFLLQELQAQGSKSFKFKEEYDRSSSSHEESESFKKEVKKLEEQTGSVMELICEPLRLLGMTCEFGNLGRRNLGSIIDPLMRFVHKPVRVLHGAITVCGKIIKCIAQTIHGIPKAIIDSLPACLHVGFHETTAFLKRVLNKISTVLKTVFSFTKQVAGCTIGLMRCAKDIFDDIYSTVVKILKNVIINTTEIVKKVTDLTKDPKCPKPEEGKDPTVIIVQCGQCVFCSFKPGTPVCVNQQMLLSQHNTMYS